MSKSTTIARMRRNGRLVRVKPDGTEEALDTPPLAPLSAAEIEEAASQITIQGARYPEKVEALTGR